MQSPYNSCSMSDKMGAFAKETKQIPSKTLFGEGNFLR